MYGSRWVFFAAGSIWASLASAQQSELKPLSQTVVVLGAPGPVPQAESSRSTAEIQVAPRRFAVPEWTDLLRDDSSVDVEQRGAGATQADISIRGTTFEQTLVLLDGLRMNDPETAHFNLDVPVPLAAIGAIEVLHGAGSTLYGADALGGVVDVQTATPTLTSVRAGAGGGSFGTNTQTLAAAGAGRRWSELAAGSRDFSSGFQYDRDYRSESASNELRRATRLGVTDVLLAGSDRAFGANQFYGDYPSFERTKAWLAALHQELGSRTVAAGDYLRRTDEFVLVRDNPSLYENNHSVESWEAVVRRQDSVRRSFTLYSGLEEDAEAIRSNNLGRHARNWGADYLRLDAVDGSRARAAVGVREEVISGGTYVFSPEASANLRLGRDWRIRAAAGSGFRLPTFLDLYYSDPTTIGNPSLLPESAWSVEGGVDWYPRPNVSLQLTGFTAPQHHTIDYTRAGSTGPYHATNLAGFSFTGTEFAAEWRISGNDRIHAGWTWVTGEQHALVGIQSRYVFNDAVQNAQAEWLRGWRGGIVSRVRLGVVEHYAASLYQVEDVAVARGRGWWQPYVQLTNAANTGYEEIQGVRMPGRALVAGMVLVWKPDEL